MRRLVRGPAPAMRSSAFAVGGSAARFATPPRRKSVMELTFILNSRAMTECASSCATTDAKNRSAVMAETRSVFWSDQYGNIDGNTLSESDSRMMPNTRNHEKWIRMSMPRMRATRMDPLTQIRIEADNRRT